MKKVFIGIDVSKEKLDATIIIKKDEQHEVAGYEMFENNKSGIGKLTSWVKKVTGEPKDSCLYCTETTGGYDKLLCERLYTKGHRIWRESALEIKRSIGLRRGKDDKADSKAIAEYAMRHEDKAEMFRPADKKIEELRQLYLYRESLVEERKVKITRAKEIKATCGENPSLKFMYKTSMEDAETIGKRIKECETRIKKLIASDAGLSRSYGHQHQRHITGQRCRHAGLHGELYKVRLPEANGHILRRRAVPQPIGVFYRSQSQCQSFFKQQVKVTNHTGGTDCFGH